MSDPITDGVIADAMSEEAGASRRHKSRSRFESESRGECSNCGTVLRGRICHSCGQDSDSFHRPVWALISEVLDGLIGLDGRLWRTLPALMFRPGYLTRRYLEGVRARYVQPFRLYLFASIAFFLLFSFSNGGWDNRTNDAAELDPQQRADLQETLDELAQSNPELVERIQSEIESNTDGSGGV